MHVQSIGKADNDETADAQGEKNDHAINPTNRQTGNTSMNISIEQVGMWLQIFGSPLSHSTCL